MSQVQQGKLFVDVRFADRLVIGIDSVSGSC